PLRRRALHLCERNLERRALDLFRLGDLLDLRLPHRRRGDLLLSEHTRPDQKDILECDPAGMLEESPPFGICDSVYRLRPEDAAQKMVRGDDDGRGEQDRYIEIEREKCERSENVKVRFDA